MLRVGIAAGRGVDDATARVDEQIVPPQVGLDARRPADAEGLRGEDVDAPDRQVDLIGAEQLRGRAAHGERGEHPVVESFLERDLHVALHRVHVRAEDVDGAGPELDGGEQPLAHETAHGGEGGARTRGVRIACVHPLDAVPVGDPRGISVHLAVVVDAGDAELRRKLEAGVTEGVGGRHEARRDDDAHTNQIIGWFPGQQSTKFPAASPNFLYPGDPGTPNRGLVYPDHNNFAPRFGFSWDMLGTGKLVMRGGFGIFYDIEDGALNLQFGGQPPFGYAANNFPCFTTVGNGASTGCLEPVNGSYSADPFQTANTGYSNPYPFIASGNYGQFFSPAIPFAYVVTPHFRTPYAENFNFGFQYQATKDTMVEAVYVGSMSRKAISGTNLNFPTLGGPNGLMAQYQYFADPTQGDSDPYSSISADCARPLANCNGSPAFTGNPTGATQIVTNVSEGSSSSNELQITVDRQMVHGLQFRVAYTLSKTFDQTSGFRARSSTYTDPLNPAFDRGLADFDAPSTFGIEPDLANSLRTKREFFHQESAGRLGRVVDRQFPVGKPVHDLLRTMAQASTTKDWNVPM